MPRNKSKKRTSKQMKANHALVNVKKMEMELLKAPVKMVAQLNKEINTNKKQQVKLSKAMNKINAQLKKAAASMTAAEKAKSPVVAKKKMKVARKMQDQAAKSQAIINKQLQAVTHALEEVQTTQSRYVALGKYLSQFNAEWTKASKATKAKTKSKAKSATVEQLHPVDNATATMDEVTELAS